MLETGDIPVRIRGVGPVGHLVPGTGCIEELVPVGGCRQRDIRTVPQTLQ